MASRSRFSLFASALIVLAAVSPARANLVLASDDDSITHIVPDIADESIDGADMAGMVVYITFVGGSTTSGVWGAIDGDSGGAGPGIGAGEWQLREDGDTFTGNWTLTNNTRLGIIEVRIDAEVGAITFDNVDSPEVTNESDIGRAYETVSDNPGDFDGTAQYSHRIDSLGDATEIGDLYGILTLSLVGADSPGGVPNGGVLVFRADTDLMSAAVPEASSFVFGGLISGVVGLAYTSRSRRQKVAVKST